MMKKLWQFVNVQVERPVVRVSTYLSNPVVVRAGPQSVGEDRGADQLRLPVYVDWFSDELVENRTRQSANNGGPNFAWVVFKLSEYGDWGETNAYYLGDLGERGPKMLDSLRKKGRELLDALEMDLDETIHYIPKDQPANGGGN